MDQVLWRLQWKFARTVGPGENGVSNIPAAEIMANEFAIKKGEREFEESGVTGAS